MRRPDIVGLLGVLAVLKTGAYVRYSNLSDLVLCTKGGTVPITVEDLDHLVQGGYLKRTGEPKTFDQTNQKRHLAARIAELRSTVRYDYTGREPRAVVQ